MRQRDGARATPAVNAPVSHRTRERLIEAATRAFAQHGVQNASLLEITRQAGQRNRGAVHYHFGSRVGLLAAVLEPHVEFLGARERELIAQALEKSDDLASAIEVLIRPTTELAATGWSGRCFLVILADLIAEEQAEPMAAVSDLLARAGGLEAYEMIDARMPVVPPAIRQERIALMTAFLLRAIGDRARALDLDAQSEGSGPTSRPPLDDATFVANLVLMTVAMLSAPPPDPA